MELKTVLVTLCLCALVINIDAAIPKCCIKTSDFPLYMLKMVQRVSYQNSSGNCDINAVVLHLKGRKKPFCAHPKFKETLYKKANQHLQRKMARS